MPKDAGFSDRCRRRQQRDEVREGVKRRIVEADEEEIRW